MRVRAAGVGRRVLCGDRLTHLEEVVLDRNGPGDAFDLSSPCRVMLKMKIQDDLRVAVAEQQRPR